MPPARALEEGVREVTSVWREHCKDKAVKPGPDFRALNKKAVRMGLTTSEGQRDFRRANYVPLRQGKPPQAERPKDTTTVFGRPSSHKTMEEVRLSGKEAHVDISELLANAFAGDWMAHRRRQAQPDAQQQQQRDRAAPTKASLGHSLGATRRRAQVNEREAGGKGLFKMPRFLAVGPKGAPTNTQLLSCNATQKFIGILQRNQPLQCPPPSSSIAGMPRSMRTAQRRKARAQAKEIWVETQKQEILTAALEAGVRTFLFPEAQRALAADWQGLGRFRAVFADQKGLLTSGDEDVGRITHIRSKQDVKAAEAFAETDGAVVMDASDWQIIPAENLVAAFQGKPARLLGRAASAADARVLLEALEVGTAGVVLQPDSPAEVRELVEYVARLNSQAAERLAFQAATVTRVEPLGMGDRVAVDMCSLLAPGEGLLVGSFSRGLFLVHSECSESRYIASRPFRANCGPAIAAAATGSPVVEVHAYLAMPGGRTAYLSELQSGREVLVVDPEGRQRTAIVGRVKIETRPLVLVEAELEGERFSALLQNAETVRLVGPAAGGSSGKWRAVPVTELRQGEQLLIHRLEAARHAGMPIQETIVER